MKITVSQKIGAAFGSAALVLLLGLLSLYIVGRLLRATARVDHTAQVIDQASDLLSDLTDAETGQRGFIITGDSAYLAPYEAARVSVGGHLSRLRTLTADSPSQQRRLDSLDVLTAEKFAELDETIALRERSGLAAAAAVVRTDRGKRVMDEVRAVTMRIEAEARRLLATRGERRAAAARTVLAVIGVGSFVSFLLAFLVIRAIRADVSEQLRLHAQLEAETAESQSLAEELERTNEQLRDAAASAEDARDEAERARAEAEAAGAAAASASKAKSDFLATMSHEIRTPINAILGYAELLELGLSGPLTEQQREQLSRIGASTRHLLALVNEVLDLAKVESGTLTVARERGIAAETVDGALALIRPQAVAKGVVLSEECEGVRSGAYVGDEHRVRQVLTNLLANAVKFTNPGGRVAVRCEVDHGPPPASVLDAHSRWVAIQVHDTGIGIPSDQLSRIFEPFTQAQSGYTRERSGTGLGLSISRRLARLMGGDISVTSSPGEGSVFTLWLPELSSPPSSSAAEAGAHAGTGAAADAAAVGGAVRDAGARRRGLTRVAMRLLEDIDEILRGWRERMRRDPHFPGIQSLTDAQLDDHAATFLTDIALALRTLEQGGGESSELMRDGTEILRVIAERHGAQRARIGWTEEGVERELEVLGEEVLPAIRRAAATTENQAAAEEACTIIEGLLDRAARVSRQAFRVVAEPRSR